MCLQSLDLKVNKVKKGYKVFNPHYNEVLGIVKLRNEFFDTHKTIPIGEWITDSNQRTITSPSYHLDQVQYEPGFHFFTRKKEALKWMDNWQVTFRIEVGEVHESDIEEGVAVTKKIKLVKPVAFGKSVSASIRQLLLK